nr:filamentous hemagglutinin [Escherichia coli]
VEASGMHRQDGNIVLDGGDSGVVHLSGTLQADNASGQGGKVVVQGQNILLDKGSSITATGSKGGGEVYIGGGWQGKDSSIRNADKVVMQDGARIDVSATQQGNGGTAVLWSESF